MKNIVKTWVVCLLLCLLLPGINLAQTCSCAGAPLISSQSISSTSQGNVVAGITYEFNEISDLYSEDNQLTNNTVERNTQSTLVELNYGITDRLTLTGIATFIQKQRLSLENNNELITRGIGDGMLMLKYVLHQNTMSAQYQLAIGGGAKIPLGTTSLKDDNIALNLDMQPGTGAWDGVLWSYFSKTFAPASTINYFLYNTYRATGTADRFNENDQYKFGNELVINTGVTDKLFSDFSYIAMASYRSTSSDRQNGQKMPNTGGKWLNIEPAIRYQFNQSFSVKISGKIPVYQHLNGIQPTTSYTASVGLFYNFGKNVIF